MAVLVTTLVLLLLINLDFDLVTLFVNKAAKLSFCVGLGLKSE